MGEKGDARLQPGYHCSAENVLGYCITAWDWNGVTSTGHTVAEGAVEEDSHLQTYTIFKSWFQRNFIYTPSVSRLFTETQSHRNPGNSGEREPPF